MKAAFVNEGNPVYRSEIDALIFSFKCCGVELCSHAVDADLVFISLCVDSSRDHKTIKLLVKNAKLNKHQNFIVFGRDPAMTDFSEEDNIFYILMQDFGSLFELPLMMEAPISAENFSRKLNAFFSGFSDRFKMNKKSESRECWVSSNQQHKSRVLVSVMEANGKNELLPVSCKELIPVFRAMESSVVKEIFLSGYKMNLYDDNGVDFCALLSTAMKETKNIRYRLGSLLPQLFTPEFYKIISSPRMCNAFSLHVNITPAAQAIAGRAVFSFDDLTSVIQNLKSYTDNPYVCIDYEYNSTESLIEDLQELNQFVQKWSIPEINIFESFFQKKNRNQMKYERTFAEEISSLLVKINESAHTNRSHYYSSLNGTEMELILDRPMKNGWVGLLRNGLPAFVEDPDFFHQAGALHYGVIEGLFRDQILYIN